MFSTLKEWNNKYLGFWSNRLETIKTELKDVDFDSKIMYLAYTDYGGSVFDKYFIQYMEENYPDNIITEFTGYNGKNAIIHGDIVKEIEETTYNYLLGFEEFEEYFTNCEHDEKIESIEYIKTNLENDYIFLDNWFDNLFDYCRDNCTVLTSGLDYSESDLIDYCLENDMIIESTEENLKEIEIKENLKKELSCIVPMFVT